jgi:hypothetical protein
LDNDTAETAQVLIVSTMRAPEINELPEQDAAWARSYPPGTDAGPDSVDLRGKPTRH